MPRICPPLSATRVPYEVSAEISTMCRPMSSVELGYPSAVMRRPRFSTSSLFASLAIKPSEAGCLLCGSSLFYERGY
jgi:hypothetical protein